MEDLESVNVGTKVKKNSTSEMNKVEEPEVLEETMGVETKESEVTQEEPESIEEESVATEEVTGQEPESVEEPDVEEIEEDTTEEQSQEATAEENSQETEDRSNVEATQGSTMVQTTEILAVDEVSDMKQTAGTTQYYISNHTRENSKVKKKSQSKNRTVGIIIATVIVLASTYIGVAYYFSQHFFVGTTINNLDVSGMSESKVGQAVQATLEEYKLDIGTSDDSIESIQGSQVDLAVDIQDEIHNLIQAQQNWLWPNMFVKKQAIDIEIALKLDEDKLVQAVQQLNFMQKENMKPAVDAKLELVDNQYVITADTPGTFIKEEQCIGSVKQAMVDQKETMSLLEEDCYESAGYRNDSEELLNAQQTANAYLGSEIVYDEGFSIGVKQLVEWVSVNDKFEVVIDQTKIQNHVKEYAKKYNTIGTTRTFQSPTGKTVKVSGGTYGWRVDEAKEVEAIIANIKSGESVKRDIEYARRAASHNGLDWGHTYAEIDLTEQRVWFIKNGQVVVDSPIVTGNLAKNYDTPEGIYPLSYKTADAVLRGTKKEDGTYEYESPVAFWMPFNGGVGMHDSSWRSQYGGQIYKTNGSHGCINMPYEAAKQMYGYIQPGHPVICHY